MNILNLMRHLCYLPHKSNAFNSKLDLWLLLRKDSSAPTLEANN